VPIVNSSVDGDSIVYRKEINIGIAVALDWGLIVPVIKRADELNILGLSRAIVDLATRARAKQLKPEEVQGGTFSITNPGVFGALFGMPIISQPQVAILSTDAHIGNSTIVNTGAIVDHECRIGKGVHICPGVLLAGRVQIEEGAFVGLGAKILPCLKVGAYATIGAAALVREDVPAHATVVGVPAHIIRAETTQTA
jgi:NDP-sugar pyrophosphorylase family protein